MLVLTRRTGESLIIGNQIIITILAKKDNQIRLGIETPREISVNREEISTNPRRKRKTRVIAID